MVQVEISRSVELPMFGTYKWSETDFLRPVVFPLVNAEARIYLKACGGPIRRGCHVIYSGLLLLCIPDAPRWFVRGLLSLGDDSVRVAEVIYGYYTVCLEQFDSLLRTVCKVRTLPAQEPIGFESFFAPRDSLDKGVTYSIDGKEHAVFRPRLWRGRRGLNPLFRVNQLITPEKWMGLQGAIDQRRYPSREVSGLYRIRSRLDWREKKIAAIEAAVLTEVMLRVYAENALTLKGISKTRMKDLGDELTFNTLLNVMLPLALTPKRARRLERHVRAVNALRKLRNALVHGNLEESKIDEEIVRVGINGAIALARQLQIGGADEARS